MEFLKTRAYPVISEAVEFFVDYIFIDGACFSSGPSISPENSFLVDGEKYSFSNGSTYEILMIRELFNQFLQVSEELNIENALYKRIKNILPELLPYSILDDGALAEWGHDYAASDKQHRHTSHLLGLYPYCQINPENTPKLAAAAEKSIEAKLTPYENWEDTGWARSLIALYYTRLGNSEKAYYHLKSIKENLTSSSLLVMHPPTRGAASFKEVYELDGNTGFSMCVIEMLMQSHGGVIKLLPALPQKWKSGYIKGIIARGNIKVNIEWEDSKLKQVVLISERFRTVVLEYRGLKKIIDIKKKHPCVINEHLDFFIIYKSC